MAASIYPFVFAVCIAGILLSIIYTDFRYRTISVVQLVLLCLLIGFQRWYSGSLGLWLDAAANLIFLIAQFVLVWIWFSLRERRPVRLFDQFIGIGDIWFLLCITPLFPFANFVWFYTASVCCILLVAILFKSVRKEQSTIPFAGGMALTLSLYLLLEKLLVL